MSKEVVMVANTYDKESKFEELDRQRDEMSFEGLDELMKTTGGHDLSHDVENIRSLEISLENEKSRLAQMEVELLEAKKQNESGQQIIIMKKQSRALMSVMEKMNSVNERETFNKQEWDMEWQERFSTFHKQHHDMEDALKIRHINELKSLQEELQRHIRRLAADVQRTKGKQVPSPRTLSHVQKENMDRIIVLFQKHSQERLMLATKIAKQEELLIRSKSQSLQKLLGEAQATAGLWYRKYNLPVPEFKRLQIMLPDSEGDFTNKSLDVNRTSPEKHRSNRERNQEQSRSAHNYSSSNSRAISAVRISLSSPRFGEDSGTFLTEIDYSQPQKVGPEISTESMSSRTDVDASGIMNFTDVSSHPRSSDNKHGGFFHSAAPTGSLAATQHPLGHAGSHGSHSNAALLRSSDVLPFRENKLDRPKGGHSLQKSVQYGDQDLDVLPYKLPQDLAQMGASEPLYSSSTNYRSFASPFNTSNDDSKPPWNQWKSSFVSQATAPIYGPPSKKYAITGMQSGNGFKKPGLSPYLISQPTAGKPNNKSESSSARMLQRDTVRGMKMSQAEMDRSRSVSARLFPHHDQNVRAASTLPIIQGPHMSADEMNPSIQETRTVFPHLEKASDVRNSKEITVKGDLLVKNGTFAKLESWIEDKIKAILSGTVDKTDLQFSGARASQIPTENSIRSIKDSKIDNDDREIPTNDQSTRSLGQEENADTKNNGEIGNLLNRLRATMSADALPREPGPLAKGLLRNGMEKPNTDVKNEGLGYFDPKARANDVTSKEDRFRGQEISQEPVDEKRAPSMFDDDESDIRREQDRSSKEQDRRERLDQLAVDTSLQPSRQSKGPKKVIWNSDDDSKELKSSNPEDEKNDGIRPNSGNMPISQPEAPESLLAKDAESRPESPSESRKNAAGAAVDLEKEYFSLIRHNKIKEFEEVLLRANVPIDTRDQNGNTALMVACQNGHKRLVKICLHHGADPNSSNHQGNTALHFANSYGYTAVASYLVSKGADDTLMNNRGQTCYDKV